jgi:HTH-type transcriptional regulator / antitoxin HigA
MSIVAERHLDLASVQSAWRGLNKLVPLSPITGERDYKRRVKVMDELLDRIGANESHRLMPLLDLVAKEVEAYEAKRQTLPEAAPAAVLAYLMEEHDLKQTDLAEERTKHRIRDTERQTGTQHAPGEGTGQALQCLTGGIPVSVTPYGIHDD